MPKHLLTAAACLLPLICPGARVLADGPAKVFEKSVSDSAKVVVTREDGTPGLDSTTQGKDNASLTFTIHFIHDGEDETVETCSTLKTADSDDQQEKLMAFDATVKSNWAFVVYTFHNKVFIDCFNADGSGAVWSCQAGRMDPSATVVKHPGFALANGDLRMTYEVQGRDDDRNEWRFTEMKGHVPGWERLPGKDDPPQGLKDPFLEAMSNPDETGLLNSLIASGVPVDTKDAGGRTAAMEMARLGKLDELKFLISKGADPNAVDNDGNDVFFHALRAKQTDVMNYLVSLGVNINALNDDGASELERAIVDPGEQLSVEYLLAHGARVDIRDKEGDNAAFYAVQYEHPAILILLVGKGADANVRDIYGRSASFPKRGEAKK